MSARRRIAIVLFNLGGPDAPEAVRPFLQNLFSDPAIIDIPAIVRLPLASLIARRRERLAIANYAVMGGASPLLPQTEAQALALEAALTARWPDDEVRVFIAMRYWRPTSAETAAAVAAFAPSEVVLAPLYPQYSTATTASSVKAWRQAYRGPGAEHTLCCWHSDAGLIAAHAELIERTWEDAGRPRARLLFSAHGVPERTIAAGDPYQWQVETTCAAIAARLGEGWDWRICYQSRVGPLKWLGPPTPQAITEAARDGLGVIVDPVAFVSEHVETLVELDRDYAELAARLGAAPYLRVPTMGLTPVFIDGLANAVEKALGAPGVTAEGVSCPAGLSKCGRRLAEVQP
ncbi:MAG TPA: ferrochelatase [Caulobacteraceae bacterium]|nr:ferrochelatase [Caulobacteraceae bacterium]